MVGEPSHSGQAARPPVRGRPSVRYPPGVSERLVGWLGWGVTLAAVAGVTAVTIAGVKSPDGAAEPGGYAAAAGVGFAFGCAIALGSLWIATGRLRAPMLGAAVLLVGVISAGVVLWVFTMLFEVHGTDPRLGAWSCGGLVLLATVATLVHQVRWSTRPARDLARCPRVPIAALRHGSIQKVVGRVVALDERLRGPVSGADCVLFVGDGVATAGPGLAEERRQSVPFAVADETGRVIVRPTRFELTLRPEDQTVAPGGSVVARELLLRPGVEVAILGQCRHEGGQVILQPTRDAPLRISTRRDAVDA